MQVFAILIASAALAACATNAREGRTQVVAHPTVSAAYSDVGMRLKLATATDAIPDDRGDASCLGPVSEPTEKFERRVIALGDRLAWSAYRAFPDLQERMAKFEFAVAAKREAGTLSHAGGAIVVLDGVRCMGLGDEELRFIIAREMGHVIDRHHDEDSATSIFFSVALGLLLPITNLMRGVAVAIPSSAALSATTTAASFAGSGIVRASYRGSQVLEADEIAMQLLADAGTEVHELAEALVASSARLEDSSWSTELRASAQRLLLLAWGPPRSLQFDGANFAFSLSPAPVDQSAPDGP